MKAFLILADGTVYEGESIGSTREVISEIVFNTSMTGYLEVLTDPSYCGPGRRNDLSVDWQLWRMLRPDMEDHGRLMAGRIYRQRDSPDMPKQLPK